MPSPIRLLPEALVRRIRAGEVVERPASLVKELVENALDAGAGRVAISVSSDCRSRIAVEDDGRGMGPDDLALSVERHATSKLPGDDLAAVDTLGFRGEALAAAGAAVARLAIRSRARGGDCAWEIVLDHGRKGELAPCARGPGTTVVAEGLFDALPARAAFLKSSRAEVAAIREAVEGAALSRPDVDFRLEVGERVVLALPASDWEARVAAVAGRAFAENSVPFSAEVGSMSVRGRIGMPGWGGHAAAGQSVLVNGRPVRDRTVSSALRAAFASASKETAPAAVVDIWIDPGGVDANAHPTKAEVRIRDAEVVRTLVRDACIGAISASGPRSPAALSAAAARMAVPVLGQEPGDRLRLPLGRVMGLALGHLAVCEASDGLVLVDVHAAHERLIFGRLRAAAASGGFPSRRLASPVVVDVGHRAVALFEERSNALLALGLSVQPLDGDAVAVLGLPDGIPQSEARSVTADVARGLLADPLADPLMARLDAICALISCHAAVRSGDELTTDALDSLLREVEGAGISTCQHGRPLAVVLPRERLESLFDRR